MRSWKATLGLLMPIAILACGGNKGTPTTPTPTGPARLTAPGLDAPADGAQLASLRPTLTVTNGTSDQTGARTYEFQISDSASFSGASDGGPYFTTRVTKSGIAEGAAKTSFTAESDLQPATRMYWRVRMAQGSSTSDWSAVRSFKTQIVGYNRPGELYDPLVNGETVAELRFKRTTFIPGKGLRIDDSDSYARYLLKETITDGEFSLDVEGISASPVSENPDTGKLKILSMCDATTDIYMRDWLMNVQYRGFNGNPDHAISFKMLFGVDEDDHKLEPDLATRRASVRYLNAANTYHWKATWGTGIHVLVQDGGQNITGIGGTTVYDYGKDGMYVWNPSPHYAYLGVNNSGSETGSWPGAIYRNVWIGNRPRPLSLGSALN